MQQQPRPLPRLPLDQETDALVDQLVAAEPVSDDPPAWMLPDDDAVALRRMFGFTRLVLRSQDELAALKAAKAVMLSEYAAAEDRLNRRIEAAIATLDVMAPRHIAKGKKSVVLPGLARLQYKKAGGTWVIDDEHAIIAKLPADVRVSLVENVPKLNRAAFRMYADQQLAVLEPVTNAETGEIVQPELPAERVPEYDSFSVVDLRKGDDEPEEPPMPEGPMFIVDPAAADIPL